MDALQQGYQPGNANVVALEMAQLVKEDIAQLIPVNRKMITSGVYAPI